MLVMMLCVDDVFLPDLNIVNQLLKEQEKPSRIYPSHFFLFLNNAAKRSAKQ